MHQAPNPLTCEERRGGGDIGKEVEGHLQRGFEIETKER